MPLRRDVAMVHCVVASASVIVRSSSLHKDASLIDLLASLHISVISSASVVMDTATASLNTSGLSLHMVSNTASNALWFFLLKSSYIVLCRGIARSPT